MTGAAFADTGAAIRSVTWSSFNKPTRVAVALGLGASEFVYGPSRARVKQTVFDGAAVSSTVTYIGKDFERRAFPGGPDHLVHYIRAGGDVVAEATKLDDANPATDKTRYLHRDHLGSVALVTDAAGAVAEERSFGPWGEARNADWTAPAAPPPLLETPRGFTGHEHLESVGLIHMNGRVYDPKIGRFMSADPSDATDPQVGFNRYAYVRNNPVSLTDPSGFEFGTNAERGYGDEDGHGYTSRGGGFEWSRDTLREFYQTPPGQRYLKSLSWGERKRAIGDVSDTVEDVPLEDYFGIGGLIKGLVKAAFKKAIGWAAKKATKKANNAAVSSGVRPNTTSLGVQRTNPSDWRQLRDLWDQGGYRGILSKENRARIARGETPVVDKDWVDHFPGDASKIGEKITNHHISGTNISVPLPSSRHLDAHMPGGYRYNPGGPGVSG